MKTLRELFLDDLGLPRREQHWKDHRQLRAFAMGLVMESSPAAFFETDGTLKREKLEQSLGNHCSKNAKEEIALAVQFVANFFEFTISDEEARAAYTGERA